MIANISREQLQFMVDINFFGMTFFVKEMTRVMGKREVGDEGSIVLITSNSTTHPVLPHFSYASSKAATNCMMKHAALEYGPEIKVNCILSGPILSDMGAILLITLKQNKNFSKKFR